VNLAGLLATVRDLEPFIDSLADAESRKLESSLANFVVCTNILVENLEGDVVTHVLHIDVEGLVPDGSLTSAVLDSSLELLLACCDLDIWVHLTESLGITC